MNKRISTLFAASLLFSSVFGSSVWAENLEDVAGNGNYYKILRSAQYKNTTASQWEDVTKGTNDLYLVLDKDGNLSMTGNVTDSNIKDATWKVTKNSDGTYTLVTASGHTLKKVSGLTEQTKFYSVDYKGNAGTGNSTDNAFSIDYKGGAGNLQMAWAADPAKSGWELTAASGETIYDLLFNLVDVTESVTDSDLNDFFNTKGFNLAVNYDSKNYTLAENIFGGTSRIWAFQVKAANTTNQATDANGNFIGYKLSTKGANGQDLVIPAGMYFFTDRVLKSGVDVPTKAEDIDWLASSLIMVSPKQTVETTMVDRAKGQGFKLVSLKGSEFIFEENTSDYKVGDNAIWNACFTVTNNVVGSYPYAISLEKFYYQDDANKTDDKAAALATNATKVSLGLLTFDADKSVYLTTVPGTAASIFAFSDSAVKDAKELLKTTKEAAVYTIKFVAGTSADQALVGKYLTVAANSTTTPTDFQWVAKGSAIANTSYPSFQYTITAVEDETPTDDVEKYTLVTFTNRETNESFQAKLFPETSYGENCYSMALYKVNGLAYNATSNPFNVQPLKVISNTYKVETDGSARPMTENIIIKLDPVSVNEYAGFYNVDDESIRTIRFARDKNDTSNCWYAGATYYYDSNNNQIHTLRPTTAPTGLFVEDVYAAAQFQLVKADDATTIDRTFVWNNTATKDVDNAMGDKISAYKYALRYVNDGSTTDYYLTVGTSSTSYKLDLIEPTNTSDIEYFYIKENADGSVSLFDDDATYVFTTATTGGVRVANPGQTSVVTTKINGTNTGLEYITTYSGTRMYAATSKDSDLKTYLDSEAPSLSWEGEGHVTLQNATGMSGDYITVNDNNEGILLNDAPETFYLHETDKNAVAPSFYISLGKGEGSNALSERNFLFNPVDSVNYPVNMAYDPDYQLSAYDTKAIFKAGTLDASRDTMTIEGLKGEKKVIASEADNDGVWGGLDRFKFQIIETEDGDALYNIRQVKGSISKDAAGDPVIGAETVYLASSGQKLYFTPVKAYALAVDIESVAAPTANEAISATDVKVVALDGAVNVKNAAGKNVVVSTILGQIVANEVLTSDNATISVPAGIAIVSVDGEEAVKVSVK